MSTTQWGATLTMPVSDERDHVQGPAGAAVTLVEYGDYECPYCGAAYPIVKEIQSRLGERLRFVFRNFPITTSHPHAEQAAESAESAAAQGRFWEMHDLLYENQARLSDPDLRSYAENLGLDVERFDKELTEHVHAARVREDFMSGVRSGVNGTPTFYINGVRHDDSYDLDTMLAALERAAAANQIETRASSSIDVSPAATLARPSSHRVRMPSPMAARSMSSRLAFVTARDSSCSLIVSSW